MYFVQLFINFEYTKAVTYTVENDGGDTGQDPFVHECMWPAHEVV